MSKGNQVFIPESVLKKNNHYKNINIKKQKVIKFFNFFI
jgi:hypothetical protein